MATIRPKGKKWQAQVCYKTVRTAKTFKYKSEAKIWAAEEEARIREYVDQEAALSGSLHNAIDRYIKTECPKHKGARWEITRLKRIKKEINNKPMCLITKNDIATWRDNRLLQVQPASVKRELTLINQVFTIALREWDLIKINPITQVNKPGSPPARRKGIPAGSIQPILDELKYSSTDVPVLKKQQVAVAFLLAMETAMRLSEILRIRIQDVDLKVKSIRVEYSKNEDTRLIPLSTEAVRLVKQILSLHSKPNKKTRLFTVNPGSASSQFRAAKHRALYPDVRFHDSRSEALTRMSKIYGVLELASIVGHRDTKSLMMYYAPDIRELVAKRG